MVYDWLTNGRRVGRFDPPLFADRQGWWVETTHPTEPPTPKHLTLAELTAGIPEILASPADNGTLRAIVIRPEKKERRDLESCEISLALGTHGDHWARGCWKSTGSGKRCRLPLQARAMSLY